MRQPATLLLAGLGFLWLGCSVLPERGDRLPVSGDQPAPTATLEQYLEDHPFGRHRDSVSFRLAMIYLSPEKGTYEPGRARPFLCQLAGRSPSPFRDGARQVLALWTEVERLRGETDWKAEQLERLTADTSQLRGAAELAENHVAEQGRSLGRLEGELEKLRGKLWLARREKATQKEHIERLERELRELKRIDTGQAP